MLLVLCFCPLSFLNFLKSVIILAISRTLNKCSQSKVDVTDLYLVLLSDRTNGISTSLGGTGIAVQTTSSIIEKNIYSYDQMDSV